MKLLMILMILRLGSGVLNGNLAINKENTDGMMTWTPSRPSCIPSSFTADKKGRQAEKSTEKIKYETTMTQTVIKSQGNLHSNEDER